MPDFLEEKKREINTRLKELRPLVEEFHRLEAAAAALEGLPAGGRSSGSPATAAAPRKRRNGAASGTGRGGRPRGSRTRSKQALELVRTRPRSTQPDIPEAMDIQQNYLYRVLPSLQKDGLVRKEGRGWHPLDAA